MIKITLAPIKQNIALSKIKMKFKYLEIHNSDSAKNDKSTGVCKNAMP